MSMAEFGDPLARKATRVGTKRGKHEAYRFAMSLAEIAKELGVCRQSIAQTERRALDKLRVAGVLEDWESWLRRSKNEFIY